MSVINGFIIVVMLLLIAYMGYRLFMKRRLLVLLSLCAQLFALLLAVLSFINDIQALDMIQACFLLLGIVIPCCFLVSDYIQMLDKVKKKGLYEGFIQPDPRETGHLKDLTDSVSRVNPIIKEMPVAEIVKDLTVNNDEIIKNIKKSLNHAQSFLSKKDFSGAFEIYNTLIKIIANCSGLFFNHGNICYNLGYYSDAALYYSKAVETDEAHQYSTFYNLGNSQFQLKKFIQALESYNKALELKPDFTDAQENIALTMLGMGEPEKAFEYYRQIIRQDDGNLKAHYVLGKLFSDTGNYVEAEQEIVKCLKLDPVNINCFAELGRLRAKQGKLKEAVEAYEGIIRLVPENYNGYYSKASLLYKLGKKKEAVEYFSKVIELKPDNYRSYYNMAVALDELGDKDEAIEAFRNTIRIKPDFIDAYNNLGVLLSTMNKPDEAISVYEAGISRNPEDHSLFLNMGITLFEAGKFRDAVTAFKTALELKPEELEIYYYLGSALTESRLYNDALEAYKLALKIKPEDSEVFYNLATVYSLLGRYDIATDNLKKAVELKEDFRSDARTNRAFDGMRGKSAFKKMVSGI